MNTEADAVQDLIATNARVAQNQDDYNVRYEALVSQYEATKAERDRVAAEIGRKASGGVSLSGSSPRWRSCRRK